MVGPFHTLISLLKVVNYYCIAPAYKPICDRMRQCEDKIMLRAVLLVHVFVVLIATNADAYGGHKWRKEVRSRLPIAYEHTFLYFSSSRNVKARIS